MAAICCLHVSKGQLRINISEVAFLIPFHPPLLFPISLPGAHCSPSCSGWKLQSQPWFFPWHHSSSSELISNQTFFFFFLNYKYHYQPSRESYWYFCLNCCNGLQACLLASGLTPLGSVLHTVAGDPFKAQVRPCHSSLCKNWKEKKKKTQRAKTSCAVQSNGMC